MTWSEDTALHPSRRYLSPHTDTSPLQDRNLYTLSRLSHSVSAQKPLPHGAHASSAHTSLEPYSSAEHSSISNMTRSLYPIVIFSHCHWHPLSWAAGSGDQDW